MWFDCSHTTDGKLARVCRGRRQDAKAKCRGRMRARGGVSRPRPPGQRARARVSDQPMSVQPTQVLQDCYTDTGIRSRGPTSRERSGCSFRPRPSASCSPVRLGKKSTVGKQECWGCPGMCQFFAHWSCSRMRKLQECVGPDGYDTGWFIVWFSVEVWVSYVVCVRRCM